MTYPGALKTTRIGFGIGYGHMPYTSAVESAGIGTAYASVFKSVAIGLSNFIHSKPIPFESAEIGSTYSSAFKSTGIGLLNYIHSRPIPAFLKALA